VSYVDLSDNFLLFVFVL